MKLLVSVKVTQGYQHWKNEFENKFDLSINKQQLNLLTELSRLLDEILNRGIILVST